MHYKWKPLRWLRTKLGLYTVARGESAPGEAFKQAVASLSKTDAGLESGGEPVTLQSFVAEMAALELHDGTRPFSGWADPGYIVRDADLQTLVLCLQRWKLGHDNAAAAKQDREEEARFIREMFPHDMANAESIFSGPSHKVLFHYLRKWEPADHKRDRGASR